MTKESLPTEVGFNKESKIADVKKELKKVYEKADMLEVHEKVVAYSDEIAGKYPDYRDYELYHALIGSGVPEGACSKFDFPGEDSVERFVEKLVEEYS
ncbi:MAG: hypothetical protein K9M15_00440 [Candidatus Marinimicrobia bacterium]|nr:hypothetical protein [Candidatus Neomarinimicrobiota bacterium]